MNKLASGIIAGGLLTALSVGYMITDKSARNKVLKNGKKVASRAGDVIDDVKDMF